MMRLFVRGAHVLGGALRTDCHSSGLCESRGGGRAGEIGA